MRSFVDLCLGFGKFAFVFLSSVSSLAKVYFGLLLQSIYVMQKWLEIRSKILFTNRTTILRTKIKARETVSILDSDFLFVFNVILI